MQCRYKKLKDNDDSLLSKINIEQGNILIFYEYMKGDFKQIEYILFMSWFSLYHEMMKTPDTVRNFHEVILGNKIQKIYIDIDIELVDDQFCMANFHSAEQKLEISKTIVYYAKEAIKKCRPQINDTDILVLNANSSKKKSYHIIIDRWCFPSAKQNKEFFYEMLSHVPDHMRRYFDSQMYSSIRNFRTYMSTKIDGSRILARDPQSTWQPDDEITDPLELNKEIFFASLVTMVDACSILPFKVDDEVSDESGKEIENEEMRKMLTIFSTFPDSYCFKQGKCTGNKIFLLRKNPSYCDICERTHEKQNSFLFLTNKNDVWLNCMRTSKSKKIGNIDTYEYNTDVEEKKYELPTILSIQREKSISSFSSDSNFSLSSPINRVEIDLTEKDKPIIKPETFGVKPIIKGSIDYVERQLSINRYQPKKIVVREAEINGVSKQKVFNARSKYCGIQKSSIFISPNTDI